MSQLSSMSQRPSYQQSRKLFVIRSWKVLPVLLMLALFAFVGQGAAVHAAANRPTVKASPNSSLICNWRTYTLSSFLTLEDQYGDVANLQVSNLDGQNTVKISYDGVYQGEYFLPAQTGYDQIEVYQGSVTELVYACSNWVAV